jgi:hypothetical protein
MNQATMVGLYLVTSNNTNPLHQLLTPTNNLVFNPLSAMPVSQMNTTLATNLKVLP